MNDLTILVDGGWLFMRNLFYFEKGFAIGNTDNAKQAVAEDFKENLARSFTKILSLLPSATNIVLMSEGGSWRKNVPIPEQLKGSTYKGCRTRKAEMDWDAAYKAYGSFAEAVSQAGVTVAWHPCIEGDDWAWFWSRKLNAEGIDTLIWSSDQDLKQLVQTVGTSFTGWYNGEKLALSELCAWPDDPFEAMINPPFQSAQLEQVRARIKKHEYINPDLIAVNKILCGDSGDNIKPIARFTKGGRTYGFSAKDYDGLIKEFNINNIQDFLTHKSDIVDYIRNLKKFAPYHISDTDLTEMFEYNTKMVWLNEQVIPDTSTTAMVSVEYKKADVAELRMNHRLLIGPNRSIESIFDSI